MNYVAALNEAIDTVEKIPTEYRVPAFKIILENILTTPTSESGDTKSARGRNKSSSTKAQKVSGKDQKSEAGELGVDDLQALKEFYESHKVAGSEECVFLAGCFLSEHLGYSEFTVDDVSSCYRHLIAMRCDVPAIENVKRSLDWLCAPSRKKMWMKRVEKGSYSLTNLGLIHLNEIGG